MDKSLLLLLLLRDIDDGIRVKISNVRVRSRLTLGVDGRVEGRDVWVNLSAY
jgi:hypothetical protein